MSDRDWLLSVAIGGVALAGILFAASKIWESNRAREHQYSYAERRCAEEQKRGVPQAPSLGHQTVQSPSPNERPAQQKQDEGDETHWCDLTAQESMAESTGKMETAAWVSLAVGAAGLILLGMTVHYTRETLAQTRRGANAAIAAAKAASDSANSATEMVRTAERSFEIERRAWIAFGGWKINGVGEKQAVEAFRVAFDWSNTGDTPAKNVTSVCALIDHPIFASGRPVRELTDAGAVVGPRGAFKSPPVYLLPEQIVQSTEVPIVIRAFVIYDTIFPSATDRITEMCLRVRYVGRAGLDAVKRGEIDATNFEASPVGVSGMT